MPPAGAEHGTPRPLLEPAPGAAPVSLREFSSATQSTLGVTPAVGPPRGIPRRQHSRSGLYTTQGTCQGWSLSGPHYPPETDPPGPRMPSHLERLWEKVEC